VRFTRAMQDKVVIVGLFKVVCYFIFYSILYKISYNSIRLKKIYYY